MRILHVMQDVDIYVAFNPAMRTKYKRYPMKLQRKERRY
jgi:hypothetical protein